MKIDEIQKELAVRMCEMASERDKLMDIEYELIAQIERYDSALDGLQVAIDALSEVV